MASPSAPTPAAAPATPAPGSGSAPAARRIAVLNQKGGVGKTTTTVNLGAALAQAGRSVLLIDLDPQAHLSLHLGVNPEDITHSVYHLLSDPAVQAPEVLRQVNDRLWVLPSETNLAGVEAELAPLAAQGRIQHILRDKVLPLTQGASGAHPSAAAGTSPSGPPHFDFVLIDCPPSLGLLTINALALASEVFVPLQAHFLALQGLSKLLETVGLVKQSVNPGLRVTGLILCLHDGQTVLANEVLADIQSFLEAARSLEVPWRDAVLLKPPIRRNIKLAECPSFGQTILDYAPHCAGARDYERLAEAVLAQGG